MYSMELSNEGLKTITENKLCLFRKKISFLTGTSICIYHCAFTSQDDYSDNYYISVLSKVIILEKDFFFLTLMFSITLSFAYMIIYNYGIKLLGHVITFTSIYSLGSNSTT